MKHALRISAAVVAGLVTWVVVATIANLGVRVLLPGYVDVERTMTFTLPMLLARLVVGAVSSLAAGAVAATVFRVNHVAPRVVAGVLLVAFLPVHYSLWGRFPAWYHLVFLGSIVPLVLLGARVVHARLSAAVAPG